MKIILRIISTPSPVGEGWGEGQFFLPPFPWEKGEGRGKLFHTLSPMGEG